MPREARLIPYGVVVHVRCRFVTGRYFLDEPGARTRYLQLVEDVHDKTDWKVLQFAFMGTHAHWSMLSGEAPLSAFFKPLNTGFAGWVNRRAGRCGPVFASRPNATVIEGENALGLGAYLHNNPPRANVVDDALQSDWTSHRAYVGLDPAPRWLHVGLGLEMMGLPATASGRRAFADIVHERTRDLRDPKWSGGDRRERRRLVRKVVGAPVECGTPILLDGDPEAELAQPLVARGWSGCTERWGGDVDTVLEAVAVETRVPVDRMVSRQRDRATTAARKVCLRLWTRHLGRPAIEMTSALGISSGGGSRLLSRCGSFEIGLAATLAARLVRAA